MSFRGVYLAVYLQAKNQRAHFAIFIPNADCDRQDVAQTFTEQRTTGTIIHVVGEPVMSGFALEFKRNYECSTSSYLRKLVPLGQVRSDDVHDPTKTDHEKETTPRGPLEKEATKITPPRGDRTSEPRLMG